MNAMQVLGTTFRAALLVLCATDEKMLGSWKGLRRTAPRRYWCCSPSETNNVTVCLCWPLSMGSFVTMFQSVRDLTCLFYLTARPRSLARSEREALEV